LDSVAEKVFTSIQLNYSPLSASSYLDFLIVQVLATSHKLFTFTERFEGLTLKNRISHNSKKPQNTHSMKATSPNAT
jgi:hypothetical protein